MFVLPTARQARHTVTREIGFRSTLDDQHVPKS